MSLPLHCMPSEEGVFDLIEAGRPAHLSHGVCALNRPSACCGAARAWAAALADLRKQLRGSVQIGTLDKGFYALSAIRPYIQVTTHRGLMNIQPLKQNYIVQTAAVEPELAVAVVHLCDFCCGKFG